MFRSYFPSSALLAVFVCLAAAAADAQPQTAPVSVASARAETIQQAVQLTGTVNAPRRARLSPSISGLVTALHVDAGSRVAQGDTLLELDAELARWQQEGARAAVEAARTALEDARRRLSEARALAPKQSIAETVVQDLAAEVNNDAALLNQAEAELAYRRGILDRHSLKAPFDGVISARATDLGEWIAPGDAVLELTATDGLRIDFRVAEDYYAALDTASPVTYRLAGDETRPRAGHIDSLVPVSEQGGRTFLIRVLPAQPDPRLIPGMSAFGSVSLSTARRGLVVPRDAIISHPDGRVTVWVVESGEEQEVAAERTVQTGLRFNGLVEIRSGLEAGARVVVKGNEALRIGQRVRVLERSPG